MTDNEIIKALECCEKLNHNEWSENMKICKEECPYKANCYDEEKNINMISDTLDLINRQQAEIERLQKVKEQIKKEKNKLLDAQMFLAKTCDDLEEKLKTTRAEAIKEFWGKLKNHSRKMQSSDFSGEFWDRAILVEDGVNLVKEMVGEE